MLRLNTLLIALVWILMLVGPHPALAQTAARWRTEVVGKSVVLTPPDLTAGEFFQITICPRVALGGALITDFLDGFADRTVATLGSPSGTAKPASAKDHTSASVTRTFTAASGTPRLAIFIALTVDGENVRVIQTVSDLNALLIQRYTPQVAAVAKEMARQERAAATISGRGLRTEELPPAPLGMTPGGKIMPGIYTGSAMNTYDNSVRGHFRLYLFASGEFLLCNEKGEELEFGDGDVRYDPITGKMDIGNTFDLNNQEFEQERNFCLYGRGADSQPYLYSHQDHGFGFVNTTLRYAGPLDRQSPKQIAAEKAAADAEAKRYKYVTAPGKGVQAAQIAGILHNQTFIYGGGDAKNETYLLLKDGAIHDGLPVPPDELDVSLSHRREPEKWGRWRRQGAQYLAAWPDHPNHFEPLKGEAALPARPGEALAGRFGTGSTSGSMIMGGSYHLWGVTFSPGARFLKDNRGGASSGTLGQTMNDFSVDTTYDDAGSVTSFSAPAAVGYTANKKRGSSRAGTYSVSGYTLTLRYDDGRVERTPFFFTDAKHDEIYFEGATMALDKDK